MLDIFRRNDARAPFSVIELTDSFNVVPNTYGRLREMNLFPAQGVRSRTISIERKHYSLNVLPTTAPGGPASKGTVAKRDLRTLEIPLFAHEDIVMAHDVQGVRAFGSEDQFAAVQDLINEKLATMASKHDITLEVLRWAALKGEIADPATGETIVDLFDWMGVPQPQFGFNLSDDNTEVKLKVLELKRWFETNLFGATMTGIHVFTSPEFHDALITHPNVKAAYDKYASEQEPLRNDVRTRFPYNGVVFEEFNGSYTAPGDAEEGTHRMIAEGEAIAIPLGTNEFKTYFAPADFMETVNTVGLPRYAKQRVLDYDRGVELHTQSSPLPICRRPQLLVKVVSGNI